MKSFISKLSLSLMLLLGTTALQVSCSSSSTGTEEAVANEEGGSENAAEPNENAENSENAEAATNEGDNTQGAENNGNEALAENNQGENANGAENFGNNNLGLNQDAEGGNALANNQAGGGDEDLNQIIEEMNNSAGNQLPSQGENQGFGNIAGAESGDAASNPLANAAGAEGGDAGNAALAANGMVGGAEGEALVPAPAGDATSTAEAVPAPAPDMAAQPAPAMGSPAAPGLPELGSKMVYIVQKGDTLAKIAQKIFGDSNKWTELANFTGIANPRLIYPGDVVYYQLTERSMAFATAYEGIQRSEVQVSQGDTLAAIAGRVLGNSSLWKLIWRQNDNIANPDRLTAGTTIYYVAPTGMANLEKKADQSAFAAKSKLSQSQKLSDASSAKVLEVASDFVDADFEASSVNNAVSMKRLI